MLAHILPSRHSAKAFYDEIDAVGVQQSDSMAGDDSILHTYIDRPGKEQYCLSSQDVTEELNPDALLRLVISASQ